MKDSAAETSATVATKLVNIYRDVSLPTISVAVGNLNVRECVLGMGMQRRGGGERLC